MKKIIHLNEFGFSLIELILVIALLGTILTIATVNLFKPVQSAKIDSVSTDVVAILREAQNKAINTDTQGGATASDYGVHFETNKYILFKGASFNAADPNNFVVDAPQGIKFTANLPSSNVVFQRISGEVASFDGSKNTVCLTETSSNKSLLLRVNFVGVVDVLQ